MSLAFVGILVERARHPRQRRLHADLGAGLAAGRLHAGRRRLGDPRSCRRRLDAAFLLHLGRSATSSRSRSRSSRTSPRSATCSSRLGLAFFLFASVVRVPRSSTSATEQPTRTDGGPPGASRTRPGRPGSRRHRPRRLTRRRPRAAAGPRRAGRWPRGAPPLACRCGSVHRRADAAAAPGRDPRRRPRRPDRVVERVRRHPYVRLALNGSFTALWAGQLISLFGDRHPPVRAGGGRPRRRPARRSRSALVFVAARCRTCSSQPDRGHASSIAGTTRRSWSSATSCGPRSCCSSRSPPSSNVLLVYPLVFLITSISIFFRPARVAILPQIVARGRPADGQLGDVGRRDVRRRHRLPAGRRSSWRRSGRRCRSRSGSTPRPTSPRRSCSHDRRPRRSDRARTAGGRQASRRDFVGRAQAPAGGSCAARPSSSRTRSRPRSRQFTVGDLDRPDAAFCRSGLRRRRSAGCAAYGFLETGIGRRQPHRRLRHRARRRPAREGPDDHRRLHGAGGC